MNIMKKCVWMVIFIFIVAGCDLIPPDIPIPTTAPPEETPVPTADLTEAPTPGETEAPTPDPAEEPTDEPTTVPTEVPTEVPTAVPTAIPTDVPTATPTSPPTATPVHYATIYYVSDTDCSAADHSRGLVELRNALREVQDTFNPVDFTVIDLGRVWDGPETTDSGEALSDLRYDFRSYGYGNNYVVGGILAMGINNGMGYVNGNFCVFSWGGLFPLNIAVVIAHELTHNWGVNVTDEGHVDKYWPSPDECLMNYFWAAIMDPNNIVWCEECRATVKNTINRWPTR